MKNKAINLLVLVTMMIVAACSHSSSESENKSGNKSADKISLAGTWAAKELTYTSKADPGRTQDMKKMLQASITMTIKANGHYSYDVKMMGMTRTESGTMKQKGNRIITDNPDFKMTLSGNTLTMTGDNQQWDFGRGKEPAISKAVFVRK